MGGSKAQPAQIIPAPAPPSAAQIAQSTSDTARAQAQARLEFDPQLMAQQVGFQQQYGLPLAQSQADIQKRIAPQLAQSQYEITAQQAPLYRALLEQQYPQIPLLSQQTTEAFQNPNFLSAQQQAAQDAIRQRAFQESERGIRSSANVGGTLYGGQRELREDRARNELAQGFAREDIALQDQRRQAALQQLISLYQLAGLPVQQFNAPTPALPGYQSAVPSGDNLFNALVQNQGNFGIIQGTPGTPGAGGGIAQGIGTAMLAKAMVPCLPGSSLIDTVDGPRRMQEIEAGDVLLFPDQSTAIVALNYQFMEYPTEFVKIIFANGTSVETCNLHLIDGKPAQAYAIQECIQGRVITDIQRTLRIERTYDLFTDRPKGEYCSSGIVIPSMIPHLHRLTMALERVFEEAA